MTIATLTFVGNDSIDDHGKEKKQRFFSCFSLEASSTSLEGCAKAFEKDQSSCSENSQEQKAQEFLTRSCVRPLLVPSHVRKPQDLDRTVVVLR